MLARGAGARGLRRRLKGAARTCWNWRIRPAWIAAVPASILVYVLAVGATARLFPHDWTAVVLTNLMQSPGGLGMLVVMSGIAVWVVDRWVFPKPAEPAKDQSRA